MIIGIHPDRTGEQTYSQKWAEFLSKESVTYEFIDLFNIHDFKELRRFDGIMWRWGLNYPESILAPRVFDIIERELNIPVYPNSQMRFTWNDKIKQYYLFKAYNIKIPKTWIFWNYQVAKNWAKETNYPKVFKLAQGAGSSNVTLVNNTSEADVLIKRMFNEGIKTNSNLDKLRRRKAFNFSFKETKFIINKIIGRPIERYLLDKGYVYFQEYIQNIGTYRVAVVENRVFSYFRPNASNDFRVEYTGKLNNYSKNAVPIKLVKKSLEYSKILGATCIAFDFLLSNEDYLVLEMCWTFPDFKIHRCEGYWDKNLHWNPGHFWPEEFQVDSFIKKIESFGSQENK